MYLYNKENNSVDRKNSKIDGYPVSGSHSWEDKQELILDKDFQIGYYRENKKPFAQPIPVVKQESEDKLWSEVFSILIKAKHPIAQAARLREAFNVTRKNQ